MTTPVKRLVFWTPRILLICFALFLVLFSFDVFESAHSLGDVLLGLFMHNLPTLFLFGILAMTWRREWIGAILFPALGIFYLVAAWGQFDMVAYLVITGSLVLVGVLFFVNWLYRKELRPTPAGEKPGGEDE